MKEKKSAKPVSARQQRFLEQVSNLNFRFPISEISKSMDVPESTVGTNINNREVSAGFLKKFCEVFKLDYNSIDKGLNEKKGTETDKMDLPDQININSNNLQRILEDNHLMIVAHRQSIENEKIALENNRKALELANKLADNNNAMFLKIQATENELRERQSDDSARIDRLQEFVLQVSTGKRFDTLEEAKAKLSTSFGAVQSKGQEKGTRTSSDSYGTE